MTIPVRLTLNPQSVVRPALLALRNSMEVVAICLPAIDSAKAVPHLGTQGFEFRFEPQPPSRIEERRPVLRNWLLSKAFHELARGVKQSLQEAYFYLEVLKLQGVSTMGALQDQPDELRAKANDLNFPTAMERVNARLPKPLHFEREFLSLNKTRNCLEHRNGVVGDPDVDKNTGTLDLALPRMKVFFEDDGKEIELAKGQYFAKDTQVLMKRVTENTVYKIGEEINFTVEEFNRIAFACWMFASDLGKKLPVVKTAA
jgi:hypothetical protein